MNNIFDCGIFTFSNEVFNRKVQSVQLITLEDGEITILAGHEDARFFLRAGKITIKMRDVKDTKNAKHDGHGFDLYAKRESTRVFYNGSGYVEICKNQLHIFAFPVLSEDALNKETKNQISAFGKYGKQCLDIWRS